MKFLVAERREGACQEAGCWARDGETVVPNFPTGARNTFLGTETFLPAAYGRVANLPGLDVDDIQARLKGRFKGLPLSLLDEYILAIVKLCTALPVGTVCQQMMTDDGETVTIRIVEVPPNSAGVIREAIINLWDRQPVPEGAR